MKIEAHTVLHWLRENPGWCAVAYVIIGLLVYGGLFSYFARGLKCKAAIREASYAAFIAGLAWGFFTCILAVFVCLWLILEVFGHLGLSAFGKRGDQ